MDFSNLTKKDYILLALILLPCVYILCKGKSQQLTHLQCKQDACIIQEVEEDGTVRPYNSEFKLGKQTTPPFKIEQKTQVGLTLFKYLVFSRYHGSEYVYTISCTSEENVRYIFNTYTPNRKRTEETVNNLNNAYFQNTDIDIEFKP